MLCRGVGCMLFLPPSLRSMFFWTRKCRNGLMGIGRPDPVRVRIGGRCAVVPATRVVMVCVSVRSSCLGSFGSKLRSCGRCAVAKCLVLSGKRTKTPVFNDAEPMEDDALDMLLMEDGGGALFDDTDESMPAEGAANSGREFFGMIDA